MRHWVLQFATWLLFGTWTLAASGQATAPAATGSAGADDVVVTVDGEKITKGDVQSTLDHWIANSPQLRDASEEQLRRLEQSFRPRIVSQLVDDALLSKGVRDAAITVTDEELRKELQDQVERHLQRARLTRDEFDEQIQAQYDMSLDDYLTKQVKNDLFKQNMMQMKYLEQKFPEQVTVTDEEVEKQYEQQKAQVYTQPEVVRASHILLTTKPADSEETTAEAKKKIEGILAEARKEEGADFAALAKEHSACPSAAKGGDLGYFPRKGKMVEPFAATAFATETGEISDVVETQFGYHIIKVTDRKPARTIPLAEARDAIRLELRQQKFQAAKQAHLEELKKTAEIVYAEGMEPSAPPSSPRPAPRTSPRTTAPAGS